MNLVGKSGTGGGLSAAEDLVCLLRRPFDADNMIIDD
jgi:hypothetical protein